jgi:hypothetical protein
MRQFTLHDVLRCIFAKYICEDSIAVNFLDVSAFSRFIVDEKEHNELYTISQSDIDRYLNVYDVEEYHRVSQN